MNLRGRFVTDAGRAVPFPHRQAGRLSDSVDGPVGELVRATRRHNFRPAHLHFMIYKPGFKTLISQIYAPDDEHIDSDVQFGVTRALIGNYVRHDEPSPEPGVAAPGIRSINLSSSSRARRGVRWRRSAPRRRPEACHQAPDYRTSSVQTLKLTSVLGPKVWVIGTSAASRPCAIRTRPMRGMLLRGSKVYQRPPR